MFKKGGKCWRNRIILGKPIEDQWGTRVPQFGLDPLNNGRSGSNTFHWLFPSNAPICNPYYLCKGINVSNGCRGTICMGGLGPSNPDPFSLSKLHIPRLLWGKKRCWEFQSWNFISPFVWLSVKVADQVNVIKEGMWREDEEPKWDKDIRKEIKVKNYKVIVVDRG